MTSLRKIGAIEVRAVGDGVLTTSLDLIVNMERAESRHIIGAPEDGSLVIPVNNFVIERDGCIILIDAGAGNTMQPTLGKLPQNLRASGIDPAQVTHVLLTHLHPDHANGLIDDSGVPHFPSAEIIVPEVEIDFWLAPAPGPESAMAAKNRARAHVNLAPYRDRITRVKDGQEILGFTAILAPGHTPGHTCWRVGAGSESFLAWGDIVHLSALQISHPDAALAYDMDKEMATRTRRRILDMVASERMTIAGAHVAAPGFGTVVRKGAGYAYEAM